jgi:hypothetical protein
MIIKTIIALCLYEVASIKSSVLDDYLAKPEPVFNWEHIPELAFKTLNGNQAHVLNVTSLEYLDDSKVYGPKGSKWDHEVIIIVPKHI